MNFHHQRFRAYKQLHTHHYVIISKPRKFPILIKKKTSFWLLIHFKTSSEYFSETSSYYIGLYKRKTTTLYSSLLIITRVPKTKQPEGCDAPAVIENDHFSLRSLKISLHSLMKKVFPLYNNKKKFTTSPTVTCLRINWVS
jgi:hypothetical protein